MNYLPFLSRFTPRRLQTIDTANGSIGPREFSFIARKAWNQSTAHCLASSWPVAMARPAPAGRFDHYLCPAK